MFVEGLMPFFIVKEFTGRITAQLEFEEKGEIYYYVQQKLKKNEIKEALSKKDDVSDEAVDALMYFLIKKFKPKGFKENTEPIHDLSKEDAGRVNAMISSIEDFDVETMVELINERKNAADRTMEINKIFKGAMTDEDAGRFAEQENALLKKKDELIAKIHENQAESTHLSEQLLLFGQQRDKAFQGLKDIAQNKHVLELSTGLTNIMTGMILNKTVSIKQDLESLIVENLQHIYRKNNLITHIEIEEDFRFNLYQNATYSTSELAYLMRNLGKDVFSSEVGKQGLKDLYDIYNVDSLNALQQTLSETKQNSKIKLYKKIDISRLSKGERQIFILSFYWAIIELSGQDIPFVIDTPYARIDANHRKEISEKFFPNISKQVVILSTDEEINEEYYELIKPHVAKEFLLINDESQNKTTVEQHYFFGV